MAYRYNAITGEFDVVDVSIHPTIPTTFNNDIGSSTPVLNVLNLIGDSTQGVSTSGAGNTTTITIADSTAEATALLAAKGVASFDSTHFTLVSGFVTLSGGIGAEIFLTDEGAPAVDPNSLGQISILGS